MAILPFGLTISVCVCVCISLWFTLTKMLLQFLLAVIGQRIKAREFYDINIMSMNSS